MNSASIKSYKLAELGKSFQFLSIRFSILHRQEMRQSSSQPFFYKAPFCFQCFLFSMVFVFVFLLRSTRQEILLVSPENKNNNTKKKELYSFCHAQVVSKTQAAQERKSFWDKKPLSGSRRPACGEPQLPKIQRTTYDSVWQDYKFL